MDLVYAASQVASSIVDYTTIIMSLIDAYVSNNNMMLIYLKTVEQESIH